MQDATAHIILFIHILYASSSKLWSFEQNKCRFIGRYLIISCMIILTQVFVDVDFFPIHMLLNVMVMTVSLKFSPLIVLCSVFQFIIAQTEMYFMVNLIINTFSIN